MFRTICFRKRVFELIKQYAERKGITFNKSVNDIIERFIECENTDQKKRK